VQNVKAKNAGSTAGGQQGSIAIETLQPAERISDNCKMLTPARTSV
jgi:hypothetical protein